MNTPLHVRTRRRMQFTAHISEGFQCTYCFPEKTKWLAFHEPDYLPDLPWRLNHKFLNIRLTEERFREMFEEV